MELCYLVAELWSDGCIMCRPMKMVLAAAPRLAMPFLEKPKAEISQAANGENVAILGAVAKENREYGVTSYAVGDEKKPRTGGGRGMKDAEFWVSVQIVI